MFRRCLTCLFSKIYAFGASKQKTEKADVFELSRSAADELALASIFGWVAASNVTVPYHQKIFATDASLHKGAVASRQLPEGLDEIMCLGGDKKGDPILF